MTEQACDVHHIAWVLPQ